jgi:hypothetical protein
MKRLLALGVLVTLLAGAQGAPVPKVGGKDDAFPDLTKIDRTIAKEPKYKNDPFYALMTIGPKATRLVWLVMDGDVLYVDRNGNGDLTETGECVTSTEKIPVAPGMYTHMNSYPLGEIAGLNLILDFWVRDKTFVPTEEFDKSILKDHEENGWEFSTLTRKTKAGDPTQIPLTFCRKPPDAQIVHLAGPLTFFPSSESIKREGDRFYVYLGTPGLPARKSPRTVFAPANISEVPVDADPIAQVEFPSKAAGKPPIKLEVKLDERGGGGHCSFHGTVRVPAEAGKGKAKVTVSFPAWKEGKVVPATFEVPIEEGKAAK